MANPPEREVGRNISREGGSQVQGVVSEGVDMADPPEREVGTGPSKEKEIQVQVPEGNDDMTNPPGKEDNEKTSCEGGEETHGVVSEGEDVADPPEREVGEGSSREGEEQVQRVDQAQDGKKETYSSSEAGKAKLSELRKRMESEKLEVIKYLENKKEEKKGFELFIPDGWIEW